MGLRIQTNIASISAQRVMDIQQRRLQHATQTLASGSRIINAADDAAGLAISETLRGQLRGTVMAKQNALNAISAIQVSEGGLNEISNIMVRLRELGIQAASDTVSDKERIFINSESSSLIKESDRIAKTTQFGDKKLLDGSGGDQWYQVGAYGEASNIIKASLNFNATAPALGIDDIDMSDRESARSSLKMIDKGIDKVGKMRAYFGATQSRLSTAASQLDSQYENVSAANSRIRDSDVAKESAELASASVLQNAAVTMLAQANQQPAIALKLLQSI